MMKEQGGALVHTFIYANIASGGAQTLIMRVGGRLKQKGVDARVVCRDVSDKMREQFVENHIAINKINMWTAENLLADVKEEDTVFTFFLRDFLMCESYVAEKKIGCKVLLYILHPSLLRLEGLKKLKSGRVFVRNYIGKFIYQYIDNGNIIFMDEMCMEWTEQFYHKEIDNPKEKIFRIPMDDIDWKAEKFDLKLEKRKEGCRILTIARADFPFKGYIKGLIEDFSVLQKKYKNLSLKIISYGPGIDALKSWIMTAEQNGAKNIELIGETRYDLLEEYYWQAHLYVGMGTTLLDAAKYGVVSVNALLDTYQLESTGFFHEFPYLAAAEKKNSSPALNLLETAIMLPREEYEKWSEMTRELFQQYYSMDIFMDRILRHQVKKEKHFIPLAVRAGIKLFGLKRR